VLDGLTEEQHEEGKKIFDALRERIFRDDMLKSHRRPERLLRRAASFNA